MRIAIVGAGPAGCHLAHRLGACEDGTGVTDHEILLFDHRVCAPQELGYEKPCGGGLSPLAGHRFPDVLALPFRRHRPPRVLLRASDGSELEYDLEGEAWAITSRQDFGQALLDRALANDRVRFVRQRVVGLEQNEDGWRVRTASGRVFTVDFLVGADGVRSIVRRHVVGPIPRQHLALAVGYWLRGAPEAIVFQTYADMEGYLWSFPRSDHASVGIATRLGAAPGRDLWRRVDVFLKEMCPGARKEKHYAALLPMARDASLWDTQCAGQGWALLGDAAGHVNPITGEGIAYALWSAELLAGAFGRGEAGIYETRWRQEYGNSLAAASTMLCTGGSGFQAYEIMFQLGLAASLSARGGALGAHRMR